MEFYGWSASDDISLVVQHTASDDLHQFLQEREEGRGREREKERREKGREKEGREGGREERKRKVCQ